LAREFWGDIEVTHFFGGPFSDEEISQRLEREITRMNTQQFQYWPIYLLADNQHVGCCGLRPYKLECDIHKLGFHWRPRYWGQRLALESARAVIDVAFKAIGANGLSADHHPENAASKKVLEKLGFRYTRNEFFAALGTDILLLFADRIARHSRARQCERRIFRRARRRCWRGWWRVERQ